MSDQNKAMKDFGDVPMATLTMTLRDWFAGQALAGMDCHKYPSGKVAQWAYNIADAMMEARQ